MGAGEEVELLFPGDSRRDVRYRKGESHDTAIRQAARLIPRPTPMMDLFATVRRLNCLLRHRFRGIRSLPAEMLNRSLDGLGELA
jgi:hypothetical protein